MHFIQALRPAAVVFVLAAAGPVETSPLRSGADAPPLLNWPNGPASTPASEPAKLDLSDPSGDWWVKGEMAFPEPAALQLTGNAVAGHRAVLLPSGQGPSGLGWEATSVLRAAPNAAGDSGFLGSDLGLALTNRFAMPVTDGVRVSAEAGVGDRIGLGTALDQNAVAPSVALRLSAGLELEPQRLGEVPVKLQFGVTMVEDIAGPAGSGGPSECSLAVKVAAPVGVPLEVSAPCAGPGDGRPPIRFGLRTTF